MDTTTACRLHPSRVQRNLSFASLLTRRYQPSPPATVLEALPAKLAADRPYAASKQDNRDAEATVSNSFLKHDHQKRGDDESTFEHVHDPMVKYPSRILEQMMQQRQREMRITYDRLQTKHVELRRTEIMNKTVHQSSKSLQMYILSFLLIFVSTRVRDFLDTGDSCTL